MKKDQSIKQALAEIAQEGTQGHSNPWPLLHDKVERLHAHSGFHLSRRSVSLLVVVALITVAAGAYYFLMDSGLQKADEAGLVAHLNQTAAPTVFSNVPAELVPTNRVSQTQNGITVTLNWAYADELRVAWQLTITGLSIPKGAMASDYICAPYVTTKEGIYLNPNGGGMKVLQDQPGNPMVISYVSYQKIDASQYDHLNVALNLTVGPCAPQWNFDQAYIDRPGPTSTPVPLIGTYHLVFQVPVNKGVTITPDQTVEASGVKMRLETITTTPSYTMVHLCYDAPPILDLAGNLVTNDGDLLMVGVTLQSGSSSPVEEDYYFHLAGDDNESGSSERCEDLGFAAPVDFQSAKMVVTVPSLEGDEGEDIFLNPQAQARAKQKLGQQGIEVKFGNYGDGFWEIVQKPTGMTDEQANQIVRGLLQHTITGPWQFIIDG